MSKHLWKPGESGNIQGRPKLSPEERAAWLALATRSREKLAEKLEAEKRWPRHEPCAQVNPGLWHGWCQIQGRDPAPSDHWTEFDVVEHIVRKQARKLQDTPALP